MLIPLRISAVHNIVRTQIFWYLPIDRLQLDELESCCVKFDVMNYYYQCQCIVDAVGYFFFYFCEFHLGRVQLGIFHRHYE